MTKRLKICEDFDFDFTQQIVGFTESTTTKGTPFITTIVEGIHVGTTRNSTTYPADELESGADTWLTPYPKPVLKNHDSWDGEPLGRVKKAEFVDSQLAPGKQCLKLTLNITDPDAIEKVKDGRYKTLSIGATANKVICSTCGKDLVKEGYCGHMKGRTYEGQLCTWIIRGIEFEEISFVNVPADVFSQVINPNSSSTKEGRDNEVTVVNPVNQEIAAVINTMDELISQASAIETATPEVSGVGEATPEAKTPEVSLSTVEDENPMAEYYVRLGLEVPETGSPIEESLVAGLDDLLTQTETIVTELTTTVATLTTTIAALEATIASNVEALKVADIEVKSMLEQNISFAMLAHQQMIERAVDLKVILGEVETTNRDNLTKELTSVKGSELQIQIEELLKKAPSRVIHSVTNPGLGISSAGDNEESTGVITTKPTYADMEEAFLGYFKSIRS